MNIVYRLKCVRYQKFRFQMKNFNVNIYSRGKSLKIISIFSGDSTKCRNNSHNPK